jgi:transposase InsO family protein
LLAESGHWMFRAMSTSNDLVLEHLDLVRDVYAGSASHKSVWERLAGICPALVSIEFNYVGRRWDEAKAKERSAAVPWHF